MFLYNFCNNFHFKVDAFCCKNLVYSLEECRCQLLLFFAFDVKIYNRTARVDRFNDPVLVVTGEDKPTNILKLLNVRSKEHLNIRSSVICLIDDDYLVLCRRGKRHSASKRLCLVPHGVQETSFIRTVDDIVVSIKFFAQCFGNSGLTDTSRSCKEKIRDLTLF